MLDCRNLNPHLAQFKFKYEDVSVAKQIFQRGDLLFTFDLKSAYHHIEIYPSHKTYVGFSWNNADKKCFYEFNVLPFGSATAPFIFTKMMRVVISWWRSKGHKVVMFLDDGLGGCSNFDDAVNLSKEIQTSLQDFGFLIAHDKCVWEPSQVVQWLGFK